MKDLASAVAKMSYPERRELVRDALDDYQPGELRDLHRLISTFPGPMWLKFEGEG